MIGKWGNEEIREWENERMRKLENGVNANNARNAKNTDNTTKRNGRIGQVRGGIGEFGRKRRSSEEVIQVKDKKWAVRRVGLAYRELIGSLYESWTIGIERVYKKLIIND